MDKPSIRDLLGDGWKFKYDPSTWYVSGEHEKGGKLSVCEIRPAIHFDNHEVGNLIADTLNNLS